MTPAHNHDAVADIRFGYISELDMARVRGLSLRTLRLERQRREGPPFVFDRRRVLYSTTGYREWLEANTHLPVRGAGASAKPATVEGDRRSRSVPA